MATYKDRVVKSVTHYEPGPLPLDQKDLGIYVVTELKRLADIIFNQATFRLERTHVAPEKPRGGDVRIKLGSGIGRRNLFLQRNLISMGQTVA